MRNMTDYVNKVADGMAIDLTDEQAAELAHELVRSKEYDRMLKVLESKIKVKRERV